MTSSLRRILRFPRRTCPLWAGRSCKVVAVDRAMDSPGIPAPLQLPYCAAEAGAHRIAQGQVLHGRTLQRHLHRESLGVT